MMDRLATWAAGSSVPHHVLMIALAMLAPAAYAQQANAPTSVDYNFRTGVVTFTAGACGSPELSYRYATDGAWTDHGSVSSGDTVAGIADKDYVEARMIARAAPPTCTTDSAYTTPEAYTAVTLTRHFFPNTYRYPFVEGYISYTRLEVTLGADHAYSGSVATSSFAMVTSPPVSGLYVDNFISPNSRARRLSLRFYETIDTSLNIKVRVLAAAHNGAADLTSVNGLTAVPAVHYDSDGDGLVEIRTLQQLNAVRWDLNGDGQPTAQHTAYYAAFPGAGNHGCPIDNSGRNRDCRGYELANDLDFDTNGDGVVDRNDRGSYPNWVPIANGSFWTAPIFKGNGHVIRNLTSRRAGGVGLFYEFGRTIDSGLRLGRPIIEGLGVVDANLVSTSSDGDPYSGAWGGILASLLRSADVIGCWTSGSITAPAAGGLAGVMRGRLARIAASFSSATVTSTGGVNEAAGGLVGAMRPEQGGPQVVASYATGRVSSPNGTAGGLIGRNLGSTVRASYAIGAVSGATAGAISGTGGGTYINVVPGITTGQSVLNCGDCTPRSIGEMQAPTSASEIYANWDDLDVDGDGNAGENPWDFGTSMQLPVLSYRALRPVPWQRDAPVEEEEEEPPNQMPEVVAGLPSLVLAVGETATVDLRPAFADPDGDALKYAAASLNESAATAELDGQGQLRVTGVAPGVATIEARATDPAGQSAVLSFGASVGTALSVAGAEASVRCARPTGAASCSLGRRADVEVVEGGVARLRVDLGSPRDAPAAFRWRVLADADPATADADAGEHDDASGEGTIAAGETRAAIEVPILDDTAIEPAREWFVVEIESTGDDPAVLGRAQARVAVQEGVCDRTTAVAAALSRGADCATPTPAALAATRSLMLQRRDIDALQGRDLLGLSGLTLLNLRGNALERLPAGLLTPTPGLRALQLGGNRLADLGDALTGLSELRELELSNNALAMLAADQFEALSNLRWLHLDGNGLAELAPDQFEGLSELGWLRLDGNSLAELPDGLFATLANLRSLRLQGNPGAPFTLRLGLERTDADPWAPGPATLRATVPTGAPFDFEARLSAQGGALRAAASPAASSTPTAAAMVPAGGTATAALAVEALAEGGVVRIEAAPPGLPEMSCDSQPCWRGLELADADPLVLFSRPPMAGGTPTPQPLHGDALRLPLASLAAEGDAGELRWTVRSSDESVAAARLDGDDLVVESAYAAEGVAQIEAVATDANGQSITVAFDVQVEFYWPPAGWRSVLRTLAP